MVASYSALKTLHVGSAGLSVAFFTVRGIWMMTAPDRLQRRWVRVVPHLIDTVLLVTAIALAVWIDNYPGTHGWLTAKVVALLAYIVLGSIAIKRGRTRCVRVTAFWAALATFAYIVSVAVTKSPAGPLVWL